jgi:uncharacterized membrane protein
MMINGLCHSGTWGSVGSLEGWAGLILTTVFWAGLLAGLILLMVRAVRRARVSDATISSTTAQPTTKEILQAQYARGEITREQYELGKQAH